MLQKNLFIYVLVVMALFMASCSKVIQQPGRGMNDDGGHYIINGTIIKLSDDDIGINGEVSLAGVLFPEKFNAKYRIAKGSLFNSLKNYHGSFVKIWFTYVSIGKGDYETVIDGYQS